MNQLEQRLNLRKFALDLRLSALKIKLNNDISHHYHRKRRNGPCLR